MNRRFQYSTEPDSGTAFEIGCAIGLSKRVVAYLNDARHQIDKLAEHYGGTLTQKDDRVIDPDGNSVENFNLPVNLMLAVPCEIVEGNLAVAVLKLDQ